MSILTGLAGNSSEYKAENRKAPVTPHQDFSDTPLPKNSKTGGNPATDPSLLQSTQLTTYLLKGNLRAIQNLPWNTFVINGAG